MLLLTVFIRAENLDTYSHKILSFRRGNPTLALRADSIMRLVIKNASHYCDRVSKYEANIYIKGRTEILRQNILMRLGHHILPVDRRNPDMLFEMVSHSIYNAPNSYLHDLEATNGNSFPNAQKQQEALAFLNLNIYSPTAYDEEIFLPIADNAFKFYNFHLEGIETLDSLTIYKIGFLPKQWSQKLVCGYLYVTDRDWTIDKIDMNGRHSFAEFNLVMRYGRILPKQADLFLRYKVLGNVVVSNYHASYRYEEVEWVEEENEPSQRRPLDLTSYYRLSADTVPIVTDSAYWERHRDMPLTDEERNLYARHEEKKPTGTTDSLPHLQRYARLTRQLTNTMNMSYKSTRIRYSGFLNPFQLSYSGWNGITYRQRFRISKTFERDRQLRFRPEIGYVFKRKQIFFKVGADWEYLPERRGVVSAEIGNRDEGYSSEITDKINAELRDSTFNFDDLNLEYFKHYYAELKHSIELFNGFQLIAGVSYHRRVPTKRQAEIDPGNNVEQLLSQDFNDFTPVIGFSYTPRQYYRMDGHRKEYLYSHYPTFAIEIAQGIPGVGKSTGNYGRVEADIHQSLAIGPSRRLNYHLSGGLYTRQKSTYFADFRYFTRRNFPESWNDQLGGVFNLLHREWFNASDKYMQAHLMYESPFVLLKFFPINSTRKFMRVASQYILSERFYLSQLWTPMLPSYTEIGYGIGNHIFNIAFFAGFDRWHYESMGVRFAFELFQ